MNWYRFPAQVVGLRVGRVCALVHVLLGFMTANGNLLPQTSNEMRVVNSVSLFLLALRDGVRHIVITEHLRAEEVEAEVEGNWSSRDSTIADLKPTTKSVVGNCSSPLPEDWPVKPANPVKPGQCVLFVPEDGIEVQIGVSEVWMHNLYFQVDNRKVNPKSSVLILQKDGKLWVTSCTFQPGPRQAKSRGIDMNTNDPNEVGKPRLYMEDSLFTDTWNVEGSGLRVQGGAFATVVRTQFMRNEIRIDDKGKAPFPYDLGSAISVEDRGALWLVDYRFQNQVVFQEEAGNRTVAYRDGWEQGEVYADPPLWLFDYANRTVVRSRPVETIPQVNVFLRRKAVELVQEEQASFLASYYAGTLGQGRGGGSSEGADVGVIVASTAAAVAVVVLAVALIAFFLLRRKRSHDSAQVPHAQEAVGPVNHAVATGVSPTPLAATSVATDAISTKDLPFQASFASDWHHTDTTDPTPAASTGGMQPPSMNVAAATSGSPSATYRSVPTSSTRDSLATHTNNLTQTVDTAGAPVAIGSQLLRGAGGGVTMGTYGTTFDITDVVSMPLPSQAGDIMTKELVEKALDNLSNNKELFLGQFELLGPLQRRSGGQGLVQFARSVHSSEGVAIKFFMNRKAFDCEEALYMREALRGMMPAITMIENNESAVAQTEIGWRYPPFIVVERGESLDEWQRRIQPDFITILQVLSHVTQRVNTLHGLGVVHRDLKPGNVLWRPLQHSWTLIDFGCAAEIDSLARLTYSLAYSPPETLQAVEKGATATPADPTTDIWAIGVIAFELATRIPAFPVMQWTHEDVVAAAHGLRPYPWETEVGIFRELPELKVLATVVQSCLARDAHSRPTAEAVLQQMKGLFDMGK